jgi:hypothetical protein
MAGIRCVGPHDRGWLVTRGEDSQKWIPGGPSPPQLARETLSEQKERTEKGQRQRRKEKMKRMFVFGLIWVLGGECSLLFLLFLS